MVRFSVFISLQRGSDAHKRTYGRLARPIRHICITMAQLCPPRLALLLFVSRAIPPLSLLLYYVRVQGVACASIMALRPRTRGEMRGSRRKVDRAE